MDLTCVNLIAEFGSYQYVTYATADRAKRDPSEEPLKQRAHALDALDAMRYALQSELAGVAKTEA